MTFLGSHPGRPVVAIDVDNTIADYTSHFFNFAQAYLGPSYDLEYNWDGVRGEFSEALGLPKDKYREVKLAYRQGGLKRWMPLRFGVKSLIDAIHTAGAEVWFCTTRPWLRLDNIDPDTREFFDRNELDYNGVIYGEDKYSQLVDVVGADRIVGVLDDLPSQVVAAQRLGLDAYCVVGDHNQWAFSEGMSNGAAFNPHGAFDVDALVTFESVIMEQINIWKRGASVVPKCKNPTCPSDDCVPGDRGEFGMPGIGAQWSRPVPMPSVQRSEPPRPSQHNPHRHHMHLSIGLTRPERVGNVFDEAQTLYRDKAAGYGDTGNALGARGQYADMNRKFGKLKHLLWDGNEVPESSEGIEEILLDLMGHAALTIDYLRNEEKK